MIIGIAAAVLLLFMVVIYARARHGVKRTRQQQRRQRQRQFDQHEHRRRCETFDEGGGFASSSTCQRPDSGMLVNPLFAPPSLGDFVAAEEAAGPGAVPLPRRTRASAPGHTFPGGGGGRRAECLAPGDYDQVEPAPAAVAAAMPSAPVATDYSGLDAHRTYRTGAEQPVRTYQPGGGGHRAEYSVPGDYDQVEPVARTNEGALQLHATASGGMYRTLDAKDATRPSRSPHGRPIPRQFSGAYDRRRDVLVGTGDCVLDGAYEILDGDGTTWATDRLMAQRTEVAQADASVYDCLHGEPRGGVGVAGGGAAAPPRASRTVGGHAVPAAADQSYDYFERPSGAVAGGHGVSDSDAAYDEACDYSEPPSDPTVEPRSNSRGSAVRASSGPPAQSTAPCDPTPPIGVAFGIGAAAAERIRALHDPRRQLDGLDGNCAADPSWRPAHLEPEYAVPDSGHGPSQPAHSEVTSTA